MKLPTAQACLGGVMGHLAGGLLLLLSGCGAPSEAENGAEPIAAQGTDVRNGVLVDGDTRWRGVVTLRVWWPILNDWQRCTAVITSRQTMVTAAHCVLSPLIPNTSGYVVADAMRENTVHTFDAIMPQAGVFAKYNPAHDGLSQHDVAVIRANVPFKNVTQADVVPIAKGLASGSTMWAMGYGYYGDGEFDFDFHLHGGRLAPTYDSTLNDYFFTPGNGQVNTCAGDSGGPLKMVNGVWMMYGVASRMTGGTVYCGTTSRWATTNKNWPWLQSAIGYANCTESATAISCW